MEELLALLETARAERAASLKDFVRLKAELARVQRRVDELRSENRELKVALQEMAQLMVRSNALLKGLQGLLEPAGSPSPSPSPKP